MLTVLRQDVKTKKVVVQASATSPITNEKVEKSLTVTIKAGAPDVVEANTVTLYTSSYRQDVQATQEELILKSGKSSVYTRKYFSLANKDTESPYLDTFEVTVETSNADVIYPSNSSSGEKVASYTTTGGTSDKGLYKIAYPNGQNFYFIATGLGTANIKVYPSGHPEYAQTYTFVVKAPDNQSNNNNTSNDTSNNHNNQSSTGNNNTSNGNTNSNSNKTTVRTGQTVEDAASGTTAKVSKVAENGTGGEVTITNITNVNVTKVTIPTTVTVNGVSYQVTAISDNLFSGFKKLSTVILPANITAIGNGAFQNCKKLKKIVIPKGVQSIGANAFAGCKNLKLITVKTTTLKSVGSNAFKGIHKKAKIKVPKKQYKKYKKLLSNKGQKKSVKIKK